MIIQHEPFENRMLKRSVFKWIRQSNVRNSSPYCIMRLKLGCKNFNHFLLVFLGATFSLLKWNVTSLKFWLVGQFFIAPLYHCFCCLLFTRLKNLPVAGTSEARDSKRASFSIRVNNKQQLAVLKTHRATRRKIKIFNLNKKMIFPFIV